MDILLNTVGVVILLLGVLFVFILAFAYTRKSNQPLQHSDKFDDLYMKLSQEIKFAVAPKSLQISVVANELVELATEIWRIELRLAKVATSLPENHRKGLENSIFSKLFLSHFGIN